MNDEIRQRADKASYPADNCCAYDAEMGVEGIVDQACEPEIVGIGGRGSRHAALVVGGGSI